MATAQHGIKMKAIIFISSVLAANAGVIKEDCIQNEVEVLHSDLDRPYLLAVDRSTNIIYFSHSEADDESKSAWVNPKTKQFQNIKGVNNGFAQTVDEKTHDIYIGGSNGIYKYDYANDKAEFIGLNDTNIWDLYYKDVLYLAEFPSQFLYTFENGEVTRFKDLEDTKVDNFIIDNSNTMFFTNATGLYSQEKGTKNAVLYKEFPSAGVRGLTIDRNGKVFACVHDGIYAVDKEKLALNKVLGLEDAFGLAFDNDNNIVYSDATKVVRVKANNHCKP